MGEMVGTSFAIVLSPVGITAWLLIGLIAGWLAGLMMKGDGYGIIGDIIVGLIGSVVGGFLVSLFVDGTVGFWGSILVAFVGACVLIFLVSRDRRPPTCVAAVTEIHATESFSNDRLRVLAYAGAVQRGSFASVHSSYLVARSAVACRPASRVAFPGDFPMSSRSKNRVSPFAASLFLFGGVAAFAGCESKGPAEKAGESIDQGIQNAKDAVNPSGPAEKAGRNLDKALKP